MAERICLMTFYPTECKDNCFNCDCGGAEATNDRLWGVLIDA